MMEDKESGRGPQPIRAPIPAAEALLGRGAVLCGFHPMRAASSARVPSC